MSDQIIEEKELSLDEYLALFAQGSADYELVKKNSDKISKIIIKKVSDGSRIYEDSTFIEKTGIQYTIRTVLD